jgi:hypothetical protein
MIKDFYRGWRAFDPARDYSGRGGVRSARPEHN